MVAYRGAYRWTRTFEPVKPDAATPTVLREGGVYLIVGSGRVSSTVAQYLVQTVQAEIAVVENDDLRDLDHATRIKEIKARFGQLNGVFYTAALDAEQSRLPIGEASRDEINTALVSHVATTLRFGRSAARQRSRFLCPDVVVVIRTRWTRLDFGRRARCVHGCVCRQAESNAVSAMDQHRLGPVGLFARQRQQAF